MIWTSTVTWTPMSAAAPVKWEQPGMRFSCVYAASWPPCGRSLALSLRSSSSSSSSSSTRREESPTRSLTVCDVAVYVIIISLSIFLNVQMISGCKFTFLFLNYVMVQDPISVWFCMFILFGCSVCGFALAESIFMIYVVYFSVRCCFYVVVSAQNCMSDWSGFA